MWQFRPKGHSLHPLRENRLAGSGGQLSPDLDDKTPSPKLANLPPHFQLMRPQRKWTEHRTLTCLQPGNQRKPIKFARLVIQRDKLSQVIPPHWRTEAMTDDRGTQSNHILGNDGGFLGRNDGSNSEMSLLSYDGENAVDKRRCGIICEILILSFSIFRVGGPCELRLEPVISL